MTHVARPLEAPRKTAPTPPKPVREDDRRLAKEWEGKRERRDDDDDDRKRRKPKKKKKKKGLLDRLQDLWDDVEDIFD